jgi:hypothetical protein
MIKRILVGSVTAVTALAVVPALAVANVPQTVELPEAAVSHAPVFLGTSVDPVSGKSVEGYAFFHHREGHNGGPGGGDSNKCYSYISRGAKWKTNESWVVNPTNTEGLSDSFVFTNLGDDIAKWEDAALADILGGGSTTTSLLVADTASPDGVNEVYFADVSSDGAIAVTIVWGIFSGPPFARELVEWDQVYDDVDFDWSSAGEAGKMDFENIATHELGHTVGMGHPGDTCTEETMYRFAGFGETKKQTLNAGDIAGVSELY